MGHSRPPGPLPHRAGRGAGVTGNARCPVSGVRARAVPSSGLATSLTAQPGSTETSPPTPPPAESWEDAELGLQSGGHRPGQGQGGRLWAKFCVATVGGVGGRQSPGWWGFQSDDTRILVTGLRPLRRSQIPCTSWVLTVPGPLVSAMTRPLGSSQGPAAAAPLCKQLLSRALASDAPAEPPAAPPSW